MRDRHLDRTAKLPINERLMLALARVPKRLGRIRQLLDQGAHPDADEDARSKFWDQSPLLMAARGWPEACSLLAARGANPNGQGRDGVFPLERLAQAEEDDPAPTQRLLAAGADPNLFLIASPAHLAAANGKPRTLLALAQAGADLSAVDPLGLTARQIATGIGHAECEAIAERFEMARDLGARGQPQSKAPPRI